MEKGFLVLTALAAGVIIGVGVFAFIEKIGFIQRIIARTKTTGYIALYQNMIVFGVIFGNICSIFRFFIPIYFPGILLFGVCSGIYTGCLAMAIAETLDFFPYFFYKSKLKKGLGIIIIALAFGKGIGALYQLVIRG